MTFFASSSSAGATLAPHTRVLVAALAVGLGAAVLRFGRRQNQKAALGGKISPAKVAWLGYAIFVWFALCPLVAADPAVAPPLRALLGAYALWMWIRGAVEMYMLYVTRNWRPPIGITHDVSCLLLLAGGWFYARDAIGALSRPLDRWTIALVVLVAVSLVVEILYAALFYQAVAGRTTGEDGVWFADDDPKFRRINRITRTVNVALYTALAVILAGLLGWI